MELNIYFNFTVTLREVWCVEYSRRGYFSFLVKKPC